MLYTATIFPFKYFTTMLLFGVKKPRHLLCCLIVCLTSTFAKQRKRGAVLRARVSSMGSFPKSHAR